MKIRQELEQCYPGRINEPRSVQDIPSNVFLVYVLVCDGVPIVLGHGRRNRARVIFDDADRISPGHIKAIVVRAYQLFGGASFERYLIECADKEDARATEKFLHGKFRGNTRALPGTIESKIFQGLEGTVAEIILRIAFLSSFDGLADLRLWRQKGILDDNTWKIVANKLQLQDPLKDMKSTPLGGRSRFVGRITTDA